jgi:hypothetical protein
MLIVEDENRHSVLVFRPMSCASMEAAVKSSMRNVRRRNQLMRAAAGQGQNKGGYNL